jgi:hypothetical protein
VAGTEQALGHADAHIAETDEPDFHEISSLSGPDGMHEPSSAFRWDSPLRVIKSGRIRNR